MVAVFDVHARLLLGKVSEPDKGLWRIPAAEGNCEHRRDGYAVCATDGGQTVRVALSQRKRLIRRTAGLHNAVVRISGTIERDERRVVCSKAHPGPRAIKKHDGRGRGLRRDEP